MQYSSQYKQLALDTFKSSLESLPKNNRWVKLGDTLPWDEIEKVYNVRLNNQHGGAGNKPARVIIGALLVKHKIEPVRRGDNPSHTGESLYAVYARFKRVYR